MASLSPTISVVVPNLNGAHLLPTCLDALRRQDRRDFETILVDDGSTDDSLALVAARYPEVRVVSHPRPLGVARGFNDGIRAAAGEIVVLLNNDTEVAPDWLGCLCAPLLAGTDPSFTTSKVLLFDRREVFHSAGDFYGRDGMAGNRGVWQEDRGQYDQARDVFGACGAAAAYRRELFARVGCFDEALGSYCEDVDLNWRARLAGLRCEFVPEARVYHKLSATGGGTTASYYVGRNVILVAARDLPGPLLWKYWPRILARQLAIATEALRHAREPAARARLRGQRDALRLLPSWLAGRPRIQATRRVSIAALDSLLT